MLKTILQYCGAIALSLLTNHVNALSCGLSPFLEQIERSEDSIVVRAQVSGFEQNQGQISATQLLVIEQFRGAAVADSIRVSASSFNTVLLSQEIGSELIIELFSFQDEFYVSGCYLPILVEGDEVIGLVSPLTCTSAPAGPNSCGRLSEEELVAAQFERISLEQFRLMLDLYAAGVSQALNSCQGPWLRCSHVRPSFDTATGELTLPSIDVISTPFSYGISVKMKLVEGTETFRVLEVK